MIFHSITKLYALLLFVLATSCVFAQSDATKRSFTSGLSIGLDVNRGRIFKHSSQFVVDPSEPSYLFQLTIDKQNFGFKGWHHLFPYSSSGFSLVHGSFGDKETFGNATGILPHFTLPIIYNEKFNWNFRFGGGAALVSKRFDYQFNPTNTVIGSKLNMLIQFRAGFGYKLSEQLTLNGALTFTHWSNGRTQVPNLGINLPTYGLGLQYYFEPQKLYIYTNTNESIKKRIGFEARVAYAFNERKVAGGPKSSIYLGSVAVGRQMSNLYKLNFGTTWTYNNGIYDFIVHQELFTENERAKAIKGSIYLSNEINLGQLALTGDLGYYVYNPFLDAAPIYFKLGGKYYFKDYYKHRQNYFLGVYMKSHYAAAEFFEISTGVTF